MKSFKEYIHESLKRIGTIKIDGILYNIRGHWTANQLRSLYDEYVKRQSERNPDHPPMTMQRWAITAGKVVNRAKN